MTLLKDCKAPFDWFTALMWENLAKPENQAKKNWGDMGSEFLLGMIQHEYAQIIQALKSNKPSTIVKDCADLGNYAMMLADLFREGS